MNPLAQHVGELRVFHMFELSLQLHDQILYAIRIWDVVKNELFLLGSCLHLDVAIIEESRNYAVDVSGDILDLFHAQLTSFSGKKAFLLDVDDALVSHDPDVEIVIDPNDEKSDPNEHEEQVADEGEECPIHLVVRVGKDESRQTIGSEKKGEHDEDDEELAQDVEPMAVQDQKDLFIFPLTVEMIAGKIMHKKLSIQN